MSNKLLIITTLINSDSAGAPGVGGIPQTQEEILTDSAAFHQTTQLVGTDHEAISSGDLAGPALCLVRNTHATATVSVGIVEATVFYPLFTIPPGETAKLPRLPTLADVYLQSDIAATPVIVSLYEIVDPA